METPQSWEVRLGSLNRIPAPPQLSHFLTANRELDMAQTGPPPEMLSRTAHLIECFDLHFSRTLLQKGLHTESVVISPQKSTLHTEVTRESIGNRQRFLQYSQDISTKWYAGVPHTPQ